MCAGSVRLQRSRGQGDLAAQALVTATGPIRLLTSAPVAALTIPAGGLVPVLHPALSLEFDDYARPCPCCAELHPARALGCNDYARLCRCCTELKAECRGVHWGQTHVYVLAAHSAMRPGLQRMRQCVNAMCFCRLYSSAHFNDTFPAHTSPEVLNTSLEGLVLLMKAMHVDKVCLSSLTGCLFCAEYLLDEASCFAFELLQVCLSLHDHWLADPALVLIP